jgi:hypothetical protein
VSKDPGRPLVEFASPPPLPAADRFHTPHHYEDGGPVAKHRLADRRAGTRVPIPAHLVHMVDLGTRMSHLLTRDATADPHGRYPALCGLDVLPAAMVDPGTGYCRNCRSTARSGISGQRSR